MARRSPIRVVWDWVIPPAEARALVAEEGPHACLISSRKLRRRCIENVARAEFATPRWRCIRPVVAARFTERHNPSRYAIVHRSTKRGPPWQITWFDELGPSSDTRRQSCDDALRELPPWQYRLREWGEPR